MSQFHNQLGNIPNQPDRKKSSGLLSSVVALLTVVGGYLAISGANPTTPKMSHLVDGWLNPDNSQDDKKTDIANAKQLIANYQIDYDNWNGKQVPRFGGVFITFIDSENKQVLKQIEILKSDTDDDIRKKIESEKGIPLISYRDSLSLGSVTLSDVEKLRDLLHDPKFTNLIPNFKEGENIEMSVDVTFASFIESADRVVKVVVTLRQDKESIQLSFERNSTSGLKTYISNVIVDEDAHTSQGTGFEYPYKPDALVNDLTNMLSNVWNPDIVRILKSLVQS